MDECLSTYEILSLICDGLEAKDLCSTALSCRACLEPALDKLWYHVQGFGPLIACLPDDLVEMRLEQGEYSPKRTAVFRRSIQPADLKRYQTQYAGRIRIYELVGWSRVNILPGVFQELQTATGHQFGALAPLATRLVWSSSPIFPYLALFLGQNVAKIDFEVCQWEPDELAMVKWASDYVHHFKLSFHSPSPTWATSSTTNLQDILNSVTPLIPWENLQELELSTGVVTLLAVPALMVAPQLVKLTMQVQAGKTITRPAVARLNPSQDAISSLQHLHIDTDHLDAIMLALECLPKRNQLRSLEYEAMDDEDSLDDPQASPAIVQRLLDLIASKCNPQTFSRLHLLGGSYKIPTYWFEHHDGYKDTDDYVDISTLFTLSSLTCVELFFSVRIEMSPEQVSLIPTAWPRVEILLLNVALSDRYAPQPRLNATHLIALLQHCSHLRKLGLRFDATLINGGRPDIDQGFGVNGQERREDVEGDDWVCGLEVLYVHDSPILSSSEVVAFLAAHFPKLRCLNCLKNGPQSEYSQSYEQLWFDVIQAAGVTYHDHYD